MQCVLDARLIFALDFLNILASCPGANLTVTQFKFDNLLSFQMRFIESPLTLSFDESFSVMLLTLRLSTQRTLTFSKSTTETIEYCAKCAQRC